MMLFLDRFSFFRVDEIAGCRALVYEPSISGIADQGVVRIDARHRMPGK
jgi:hypothetical protein